MLSKKGISPIIASVLIILVVVAMASTYTIWSSRIFSEVTEEGGETVTRTTQDLFSDFTIQGASGQRVFIKNTGTSELSAAALDVFYDGEPITFTADFDILEEDELGELTLRELWKYGPGDHAVRTTAGSFGDTATVTASPISGAVAYWKFDEGSGTLAEDDAGSNDGTVNGATWINGKFGKALDFDGINDYISVPNSNILNPSQVTVAAWIRTTNTSANYIIDKSEDSFFLATGENGNPGKLCFWLNGASENWLCSPQTVTDGEWHFVAGTYDGSTKVIYIDEEFANSTSGSGSIASGTSSINIGRRPAALDKHFDGTIDEILLYDRALTPEELYELKLKS